MDQSSAPPSLKSVLLDPDLLRLNLGIFVLHCVQLSMFIVMPAWLIERGMPLPTHWQMYLPTVLLSFAVMMRPLNWGERQGRVRTVFLGSVALLVMVMAGFATAPASLITMGVLLFAFFAAFNVLEAVLPAQISRLAPSGARGTALGVYNTTQALGLFAGGSLGGWALSRWGGVTVFALCAAALGLWLLVAMGQRRWPSAAHGDGHPQPDSAARSATAH